MKRTYMLYCQLEETGQTVFCPVMIECSDEGTPKLDSSSLPLQKQRLWEALCVLEGAVEEKYPEEMEKKLPVELRGLKI